MTDEFSKLKKEIETTDAKREELIAQSRSILLQSKKAIYAMQRGDTGAAATIVADMKKAVAVISKFSQEASYASAVKPAIQEYVEAACFNEFIRTGKLLPSDELGVSAENYIAGLCDVSGEIIRKAVNAAINDDAKTVASAKSYIEALYYGLMQFEFRNGELRRKFDGLKYDLKKMEDLVLSLKLQGKAK